MAGTAETLARGGRPTEDARLRSARAGAADRPTASAIYVGTVRHRRHDPIEHAFTAAVGMLYLDLDELHLLEHRPLWSATRPAIGRFRRADYLGDPDVPLKHAVAAEIRRQTGANHHGPIRLLTTPRTFGRAFNPVSFYYCFAADGTTVEFVVAEVTNTPWGQRHSYVLDARANRRQTTLEQEFDKVFHVSPFMGMDHRYAWSLTVPGPTLSVNIDSATTGPDAHHAFDATLKLHRRPLTDAGLRRLLLRFPFQTLRTGLLIYGHAVRLKLKGAPYFAHPEGTKPPLLTKLRRSNKASAR
ncbi:hypothetical protein DSM112329_00444 [Paraconexibacter sp. AEG42_29]|uniref:DUF1365 domain-containing protein n=1 Tax=Paraconexibacter sp. AEG42_29 TaxID=2997339 RepID=A0AAU7APY1_9ACTN